MGGEAKTRVASTGAALVAVALIGLVLSAAAQAAPGDLDLTFSGDGKQTTNFPYHGSAAAIARQPDGKIIAAGTVPDGFALARYNTDGSLDPTFSGDGEQTTDFGTDLGASGNAVAIQPNGKIVVVGRVVDEVLGYSYFAVARYNTDGSLDPSFSGDGLDVSGGGDYGPGATGVAIQPDGKIVVVGGSKVLTGANFVLIRYRPNGTFDGRVQTNFGGGSYASDVAIQPDGKIVVAGSALGDFAVARYNRNGSLDKSFSGDGRQLTPFAAGDARARGLRIQSNGKIVVAGHAGGKFAVARYKPNGSLDKSFSGDGRRVSPFFGSDSSLFDVAFLGSGKIVAVGRTDGEEFAAARYNRDGSPDTSFSGDGRQVTPFGDQATAYGAALAVGGPKIVVVGASAPLNGPSDFALARYRFHGSLDTSFSGDGLQTTDFSTNDAATGVALQGDGKIVAVGVASGAVGSSDFALARYNPAGSLDPTFSGDGEQTIDLGGSAGASGVAIQPDGKIVVVGKTGRVFALTRYDADGSLDPSFSSNGVVTTSFGGSDDGATGVALQGDGKIVAVGRASYFQDFALARYNTDGSLDTQRFTNFGGNDGATGVALQADGKIVTVGKAGGDFALARYNTDGLIDPSFSGNGRQTTDFGGNDGATGVALQADGKIVVIGKSGAQDFALARYNTDGSLDTSFSGDGKQTTDFGGDDGATGVALQGDGKIVAVGKAGGDFALARYNTDGSLDTSFSGDGKQTTDFGGDDGATGVALQSDGKIVMVGSSGNDFALARYLGG